MRSPARIRLAEAIRSGPGELAERWVRFATANDLLLDTEEPLAEMVNHSRLAFEVLANLLDDADYKSYENVVRRLLHDWINRAGSYSDLLEIERAFAAFMLAQLDIASDTDEAGDIRQAIDELFHSDIRINILSDYLLTYEDIIGTESRHTAYVLAHFDAILSLTAHLNAADTLDDILAGLAPSLSGLFDNVHGALVWIETPRGLTPWSLTVLDEDIPPAMLENEIPERFEEIFDAGEIKRVSGDDFPQEFRNALIEYGAETDLSGCAIPIRPKEGDGALVLIAIGSQQAGQLDLSLSRVAVAECALAFERVAGRARLAHVNRQIRDILSLSRETGWGTAYRETAEVILDHLLDLTGSRKALLLALPPVGSGSLSPVASRDIDEATIAEWRRSRTLHPLVSHSIGSGRIHLLPADRLGTILAGRKPPVGFSLSEFEAVGILPLSKKNNNLGVCVFTCSGKFAVEAESRNLLAVFAGAAADGLATAREYERSLATAKIAEVEADRTRRLQEQLTPQYCRSGKLVFWAHIDPAADLAGDIIIVRPQAKGGLAVWAADVAGRGLAAAWSMMYLRQLIAELPADTSDPASALSLINSRLYDIEAEGPSGGIFATGLGLVASEKSKTIGFARAGAPKIYLVTDTKGVESREPDGFPLGLFQDIGLEALKLPFKHGDKVVWVSDGLLNAENDSGSRWGERRLTQCLEDSSFLPARALYEKLLASLGEFGAVDTPHDDRSLFVIGHDIEPTWEKSRPGASKELLQDEALAYLAKNKLADADLNAIRLLLDEAIRNANEHGNRQNTKALIEVKLTLAPRYIHLRVRDEGGRLNEQVTSVPLRAETLLEDKGRGFLLMRHYSDCLWVEDDSGELNAVRLRG